jgi:pimeloyl-ACP methyl ester carboxylesterase
MQAVQACGCSFRPILLAVLAAAALVGCAAGPRATRTAPTAGETLAQDAAGLFVDCRGTAGASPTVILEAGAFGTSADWDFVLNDLAKSGRVCAYDRAGLGRSAPSSQGVDVLSRARELGALLDRLGETRPVMLVGHSNGALYIEAFARLWPRRVAGLVYVNGVGSDDLDYPALMANLAQERQLSRLAATLGHMGLSGLVADQLGGEGLDPAAAARKRASLTCLPCLEVARDEDVAIVSGLADVRSLPDDVRAIPTVVIGGATEPPDWRLPRDWRAAETAPARRAAHAWILYAQGASHVSPLARDRAYIDAAVAWLRAPYQAPMFSMAVQGSAGTRAAPFCRSSMEMPSGERTKAMRPSRGGRLMVTP